MRRYLRIITSLMDKLKNKKVKCLTKSITFIKMVTALTNNPVKKSRYMTVIMIKKTHQSLLQL